MEKNRSWSLEEPPNPLPLDIPMRTSPVAPKVSNHLQHPQPPPRPKHPQGASAPPLLHTLTLEAAVGVAQRHVALVDDKIDLLQGQRWGISVGGTNPSPPPVPSSPFPKGALCPPSGTPAGAGGPGVPWGWRPRRCGRCPGCC